MQPYISLQRWPASRLAEYQPVQNRPMAHLNEDTSILSDISIPMECHAELLATKWWTTKKFQKHSKHSKSFILATYLLIPHSDIPFI